MKLALAFLLLIGSIATADRISVQPIYGRPLKLEVVGSAVAVTVGVGKDGGVASTDICAFVDEADKPSKADCSIVRVDKKMTVVKTTMTSDQIKAGPFRVRFTRRE